MWLDLLWSESTSACALFILQYEIFFSRYLRVFIKRRHPRSQTMNNYVIVRTPQSSWLETYCKQSIVPHILPTKILHIDWDRSRYIFSSPRLFNLLYTNFFGVHSFISKCNEFVFFSFVHHKMFTEATIPKFALDLERIGITIAHGVNKNNELS